MAPHFTELAGRIFKNYAVMPINICFSFEGTKREPTLKICFKYEHEVRICEKQRLLNCQNRTKAPNLDYWSAIRKHMFSKQSLLSGIVLTFRFLSLRRRTLWTSYSSYEAFAKAETNDSIPSDRLEKLKKEIGQEDLLWTISRAGAATIFFLFTKEQVTQYERSDLHKDWSNRYYELLKPYDEFGYYKQEDFWVNLDSKENFDNNYQSNWYYYYK